MLSDVYCLPIANTAPFESQQTGSLLPSVVSAAMSVYWGALFACVSLVSSINQQDWRVLIHSLLLICQAAFISLVGDGQHPNIRGKERL